MTGAVAPHQPEAIGVSRADPILEQASAAEVPYTFVEVPQLPTAMDPLRSETLEVPRVPEPAGPVLSLAQTATAFLDLAEIAPNDSWAECWKFRELVTDGKDWDPEIALAMAWRESRCSPRLISPTNDWGLMQINATCWAGTSGDRLPDVDALPESIAPFELLCDDKTQSTPAAKWCHVVKEALYEEGDRQPSPCDRWLDPTVNVEVAYLLWQRAGWQPWCFNDFMRSTKACQAAAAAS